MNTGLGRAAAIAAGLAAFGTAPAWAADLPYLGTWLIAEAHPAPWYDPKDPQTAPFDDRIAGKTVIFTPTRIIAPRPLACRRPNYQLRTVPPEVLFQGGLTHPAAQATALGFAGKTIRTLETGCNGWFEFHFTQAGTALFALNNMIYTLRRR
jgi:hypothetical protein